MTAAAVAVALAAMIYGQRQRRRARAMEQWIETRETQFTSVWHVAEHLAGRRRGPLSEEEDFILVLMQGGRPEGFLGGVMRLVMDEPHLKVVQDCGEETSL